MFKEFKEFALSGNLIDIAVGLVLATAFAALSSAFVDGIFMPVVGNIFQVGDLSEAKYVLSNAVFGANGEVLTPESALHYGQFIAACINFLIIAFAMFIVVKAARKANLSSEKTEG